MAESELRKVALAFLAHPDDAEIFCGGTLIRLRELGWNVHIVTATPGDCGSATLTREEIAGIRRAEATAAAESIGATYDCLEECDVHVVCDKPSIGKAIGIMRQVAPSLVFTHPRFDYMLDHEQVHMLARAATFAFPIPNASQLDLVEGSGVPWLYYCDSLEGVDPYSGNAVTPTIRVDISDQMERKLQMLACHASQREWLRSHHGIDEYLDAVRSHNEKRGRELGVAYAEAFVQHKGHPYPKQDLLKELFGEGAVG